MKGPTVVIVDPSWQVRERLRRVYERRGYAAWTCPGPEMAIPLLQTVLPDLALIDLEESSAQAQIIVESCLSVSPATQIVFRRKAAPTKAA